MAFKAFPRTFRPRRANGEVSPPLPPPLLRPFVAGPAQQMALWNELIKMIFFVLFSACGVGGAFVSVCRVCLRDADSSRTRAMTEAEDTSYYAPAGFELAWGGFGGFEV